MTIICVGVSHREASIAVREQLAVRPQCLSERLRNVSRVSGVREAMVLSTCNRFEIFAAANSPEVAGKLLETLGSIATPVAHRLADEGALRHLFRIAASLDSMVQGEAQILGQVKQAMEEAKQAATFGPELERAVARALRTGKRVRTETGIARGAASVSSVAVELDDLERIAAQNRGLRDAEIGKAESIVEEELRLFLACAQERTAVVARLRGRAEAVARSEVDRTLAVLRGLDERQRNSVQAMANAIVDKLLHGPTMRLCAEAGRGRLGDAAAALFGLDELGTQPESDFNVLPLASRR
jgi:glutamyl-tRNA reductase